MVNIAFFSTKPYDRIWFEPLGEEYGYRFIFFESKLSIETVSLAAGCNGVCAFVNDNIDGDVINELADIGVETVYMRCAGYNNVDLEAAKGKLKVLHVPGYSPEAVAEYAVALLMTINRHTHRAYLRTRDFNMNINGLMGTDLYCKIIGIIGTGRIGQAMINIAKGFGMRVLAYDLYPNPSLGVEYVELDELLEKSDVISLHCPLTKETEYILDKRSFDRMKDGVYIVNTDEEYAEALKKSFRYEDELVVEPYIKGREFACGIIDGTALPPIEIIPKTGFFDYANKYQDGATSEVCPADIPEDVAERMKELTVKAFNALKLNVYSRADFLLDAKGNLFCLEMNTLPGMTSASLLPKEAKVYGIEYGDLCELIIKKSMEARY